MGETDLRSKCKSRMSADWYQSNSTVVAFRNESLLTGTGRYPVEIRVPKDNNWLRYVCGRLTVLERCDSDPRPSRAVLIQPVEILCKVTPIRGTIPSTDFAHRRDEAKVVSY